MSDRDHLQPKNVNKENAQEARQLTLDYMRKLQEFGWSCHMGYDGYFFLEKKEK